MADWIEGQPTEAGTYWVRWEDQAGWPSVDLCIVRERVVKGSPRAPSLLNKDKYAAWAAKNIELLYCLPESSDMWFEVDIWQPIKEIGWRATHYQRVERPGADL